jgi:tetratricopeptide (TPR) repeat protein
LADAHYALAAPYLNMGRYSDAEYELNLAIRIQETANAVLGLGFVRLNQGRNLEAIPYFQRAVRIGPPASLYYMNLGTAWRIAGFPREANQAYVQGLELAEAELAQNFRDGNGRSYLAYLCARLHMRKRAESEIQQALSISKDARVRWMAVQTYEALGMRERTLDVLKDAPASMFHLVKRSLDLAQLQADPGFQQLLASRHIQ